MEQGAEMTKTLWMALAFALAQQAGAAPITVRDDDGNAVTLQKPARRIVSTAPHVTESLFAAGGGDRIVGTVSYSDFPEAAKRIPQIGNNRQIDIERVLALKPDLIVAWLHGTSERQLESLRKLGIPVFHSEPKKLDDIADNIARLGLLMGTEKVAQPAAAELRQKAAVLAKQYANRPPVRVFYQVWDKPLFTLNGGHIVSEAIRLCGGENVFAKMKVTAPEVGIESVLQEDPEAIIGTNEKDAKDGGVAMWRRYPTMKAVRNANLFAIDSSLLNRSGPRMIIGATALCEQIELARKHRKN
jgi:iron complex transport system substrate-binding protein